MERSKAVEWIVILYIIAWRVIRVYEEKRLDKKIWINAKSDKRPSRADGTGGNR